MPGVGRLYTAPEWVLPSHSHGRAGAPPHALQVDFYVGGELKLEGAIVVRSGNGLQFTGKETKGTPLSFVGFNLEDTITVGATPADPANADLAMALVK